MIRRPPRSTLDRSSAASDVYKRQVQYVHHLEQSLKAEVIFKLDRDYVVKDGEVIIVDDFTGRLMPGRRYSEGLHQAIDCLLYTSPSPRDRTRSRMPSSA